MTHAPVVLRPVEVAPSTLLALHAQHPQRYPALLESAASGSSRETHDILFAFPGERLSLFANGRLIDAQGRECRSRFLDALDKWWQQLRQPQLADVIGSGPVFSGGWLIYLGYELAGQIEQRLRLHEPAHLPIAQAIRVPAAIVTDRAAGKSWIVTERESQALLDTIEHDLRYVTARTPSSPQKLLLGDVVEEAPQRYLDAVAQALEHILAGDIYQANLSRAWHASLATDVQPHHLYQRLRETNPGPFSGLAVLDGMAIVSSSPERLVCVHQGSVATRPIAGTRPRGADARADEHLARELHAHPKERAEHVMLIDLERNDLGRVCEPGTVHVDEFMSIESYAHVHHIVSNVRGSLRRTVTPGQVLAAVFPGGTITGCPKVRCMEIIAGLEQTARGAYTGSLGYLNRDGSMDFNILIRSIEIAGGELCLRTGAGIVADSVPEQELQETRAKALGVLRALAPAV
jgi:anthranilate synthase component 1